MNISIIITILTVLIIIYAYYQKSVKYVKQNSILLQNLLNVNNKYKTIFKPFLPFEKYHQNCTCKQQYDNFNKDSYFMTMISENLDRYNALINDLNHNKKYYNIYQNELNNLLNNNFDYESLSRNSFISVNLFQKIERAEFKKNRLHPPLEFIIELCVSYTSPKGQNRYSKRCSINSNNILYYCNECAKVIEYKQSAKYQRSLMTDKLRYQVLNRDHHRCVICGASAKDGMKLHVDHIIPVSKGGKTELSNLRTLCERCNLGKGASYNPNGYN